MSKSQKDDKNENENANESKNENENANESVNENVNVKENDETLMSSDEDEDDEETMSQNEKKNKIMKELNDHFDNIIDKSKPFEKQIKLLQKRDDLKGYWPYNDHGDKELKFKQFKIELAEM